MVAGAATEASLQDRLRLAEDGAVTALLIVNPDTGRLEEEPEFFPVGFAPAVEQLEKATGIVEKTLMQLRGDKTGPDAEKAIAQALIRWSDRALRRKPVVTVIIVEA
jgi:ribonuclease J